jgi:septal ring factor EnvC (AmiA/AmiB activator)
MPNTHAILPGILFTGLLALATTACQSTGDPTQGGIFWSESKTQQRQRALEQQNAAAQGRLAADQQQQSQLQAREGSLQAKSARLRAEVDHLMSENTQLENRLRDLLQRRSLGEAELARLNGVLAQNERLRQLIRSSATAAPNEGLPDTVNDQNNELHHEIMLLLPR